MGVLRGSLERLAEGLLKHRVLVPQRARELPQHGVADDHRRELAARQHVAPDRQLVGDEVIEDALIEALVASAEQRQLLLLRQLVHERVVEQTAARGQRDHPPIAGQRYRVDAVAGTQRGLDDIDAQHHPGAAAERHVVDLSGVERRVVAVVDVPQPMPARDRISDVALALEPPERVGEQGEHVDLHHASPRNRRSMSIVRASTSTSRTASATSGTSRSPSVPSRATSSTSHEGSESMLRTTPTCRPPSWTVHPTRSSAHHSSSSSAGATDRGTVSSSPPSACAASRSSQPSRRRIGRAAVPSRRTISRSRPATVTRSTASSSEALGTVTWKLPSSPWGRPTLPARSHPVG